MRGENCFYSVMKFVPDVLRNEPINIGVVLQCNDQERILFKGLTNFKTKIGSKANSHQIDLIKSYFEDFNKRFYKFSRKNYKIFQDDKKYLEKRYLENLNEKSKYTIHFSSLYAQTLNGLILIFYT